MSAMFSYCDKPEETDSQMTSPGCYNIAVDYGVPGHYVLSGKRYGYFYEIAEAYASQLPEEVAESSEAYFMGVGEALHEGVVDMALVLTSKVQHMKGVHSMPLYTTSYVMLARKCTRYASPDTTSVESLVRRASVTLPLHFTETESYGRIAATLPDSLLNVSTYAGMELASQLNEGRFDMLVCERGEAQVALGLYRNLCEVYSFADPLSVSVAFPSHRELREFGEWVEVFRKDEAYSRLNEFYSDNGVMEELKEMNMKRRGVQKIVVGGISAYDDCFMEVGEREGVDWRLLSAIAYEESGFSTDVCSDQGAMGIMQIMPGTAAALGADSLTTDVADNIVLAARLLKRIEATLKYDALTPEADRMKIALAAYNCGTGRIMTAMEIVHEEGKGCCSWERVSGCLANMADAGFVSRNHVRTGQFCRYRQTLNYVEDVYSRYLTYCKALQ